MYDREAQILASKMQKSALERPRADIKKGQLMTYFQSLCYSMVGKHCATATQTPSAAFHALFTLLKMLWKVLLEHSSEPYVWPPAPFKHVFHLKLNWLREPQKRHRERENCFCEAKACSAFRFQTVSQETQQNISAASHEVPIMERSLSKKRHQLCTFCSSVNTSMAPFQERPEDSVTRRAGLHGKAFKNNTEGWPGANADKNKCLKLGF